MANKTVCKVTKAAFKAAAKSLVVGIGSNQMVAQPKEFSTGSFGWNANGKAVIDVGGEPVTVQVNVNLIVVGSKEAA